uniref:Uncharacterized protein n=1 Tax=viral metagenome TaxID=1070528 RepID=A0A6C0HQ39_9ZZZZ
MTVSKKSSVYAVSEVSSIQPDKNIHKITDELLKIQVDIMIGIKEYTRASTNFIASSKNLHFKHLNIYNNDNIKNMLELISAFNQNIIEHCALVEISYDYNIAGNNLLSRMKDITIDCDKLCKI